MRREYFFIALGVFCGNLIGSAINNEDLRGALTKAVLAAVITAVLCRLVWGKKKE